MVTFPGVTSNGASGSVRPGSISTGEPHSGSPVPPKSAMRAGPGSASTPQGCAALPPIPWLPWVYSPATTTAGVPLVGVRSGAAPFLAVTLESNRSASPPMWTRLGRSLCSAAPFNPTSPHGALDQGMSPV